MAWRDEPPGVHLRPPLPPALALRGRDRERLDPPASARCRERGVSGVARPPPPQGLESAGSARAAMCAVFALPPRSDFPPRPPRRNSVGVVIPFPLPCF